MLKYKLDKIKDEIDRLKMVDEVTILVATKCVEAERIDALYELGITEIGENRVQELLEKYDSVKNPFNWHFIGRLQTNKVKYIIDKVKTIQSVDSERLALEINKQAIKLGVIMPVLVEVNAGREANKGGVFPENADELCRFINGLSNVSLIGIMCVFPIGADEMLYEECKDLFDTLKNKYEGFTVLSMGMSADYALAVKHGSTMIRVGSAIFGKRNYERIN